MQPQLLDMGGTGRPLLFAHANGFPPASYRRLFDALAAARVHVMALEHRPLWGEREPPPRLDWGLFADDLLSLLRREFSEPVWVMGHSMGGTASILAAGREPRRFAGLVLLDPVVVSDRSVLLMRMQGRRRKRTQPMVRAALRRPGQFASLDDAFAFYRGKRAFSGLADDALWDYVRASKAPTPDGGVQLRFPAAWEAAIYQTVPRVSPVLKRLTVPTLGLRGRDSGTLLPAVWQRWRRWQPGATLRETAGGHLFPLEQSQPAAAQIADFLGTVD